MENEPCFIGVKRFSCQFFCHTCQTFMGRGIAQLCIRIGHITFKHGIPPELSEYFSFLSQIIKLTAMVAGRIKGILFSYGMMSQSGRKRRKFFDFVFGHFMKLLLYLFYEITPVFIFILL